MRFFATKVYTGSLQIYVVNIKDENLISLNPDFLIICPYVAVSG